MTDQSGAKRAFRGRVHRTIRGALKSFVHAHPDAIPLHWQEAPEPGNIDSRFQLSLEKRVGGAIMALLKREGLL